MRLCHTHLHYPDTLPLYELLFRFKALRNRWGWPLGQPQARCPLCHCGAPRVLRPHSVFGAGRVQRAAMRQLSPCLCRQAPLSTCATPPTHPPTLIIWQAADRGALNRTLPRHRTMPQAPGAAAGPYHGRLHRLHPAALASRGALGQVICGLMCCGLGRAGQVREVHTRVGDAFVVEAGQMLMQRCCCLGMRSGIQRCSLWQGPSSPGGASEA